MRIYQTKCSCKNEKIFLLILEKIIYNLDIAYMYFFSIIVPIYNTKKEMLEKCISSIRTQTFSDFEVLYINDGSTNKETLDFLLDIKLFRNEKIINMEKNKGLGEARNFGINLSLSKYIIFLDSDDILLAEALEKIHKKIVETSHRNIYQINFFNLVNDNLYKNQIRKKIEKKVIYSTTSWSFVIKRIFIKKQDLFFLHEKIIHEDEYFFF